MNIDFKELESAFAFLDVVRASGSINMLGAAPYVAENFGMDKRTAREVTKLWMETFDGSSTPAVRAVLAMRKRAEMNNA